MTHPKLWNFTSRISHYAKKAHNCLQIVMCCPNKFKTFPKSCKFSRYFCDDSYVSLCFRQFCPLPKLTEDNRRILLIRYKNSNPHSCVDVIKMLLMMLDARYSMLDEDGKLAEDDVLIIDLKGYTFKHFFNAARNSKTIFLYFKYSQETVPIPTRSCHILNSSIVVNSFMSLIRPMLRKEVADSFQFHSGSFENLHKSVSKEILPKEYGGNIPMDDLHQEWMEIFSSKR